MADTTLRPRRLPRGSGRPRKGRVRRSFGVILPPELAHALEDQATQYGMRLGPYLELLLAAVHDTWTPFIQPPASPLPTAVPMDVLRDRVAGFTPAELYVPAGASTAPRSIRVDEDLAARIEERCERHQAMYSEYLRAIFRAATGLPTSKPLAAAQPRLPEGSDAHLAHAS